MTKIRELKKSDVLTGGRGIVWQNRFPKYGEKVAVDDSLNLYFTKVLS